jgi:hypothetical protein
MNDSSTFIKPYTINSFTSWQPLEECIVGRCYTPDYFDFIIDEQVRRQLQKILHETTEDLDALSDLLRSHGVVVRRPRLIDRDEFQRRIQRGDDIPRPPLTPRDWQITLGQRLLRVCPVPELDLLSRYYRIQQPGSVIDAHANGVYDPGAVLNGASASCVVRVGRDIFFDNSDFLRPEQSRWIIEHALGPEYRVHEAVTDGHGDAVFAILKPGVILSSRHDVNLDFDRDFPGWEVCRIWDSSIWAAMEVGKFKHENNPGPWYLQGETPTAEFKRYVDTYLTTWTGYVAETVFDVNCLVLDESHVIFSAYNQTVFDFCERHNITPIISELRHSYFWDGGISCCTQDIRRRGGLETYL